MASKRALVTLVLEELLDDEPFNINPVLDMPILAALITSTCTRKRQRVQEYVEEVVPKYSLDTFKTFFRVERSTFEEMLSHITTIPVLQPRDPQAGRPQVPVEKDLLMTLWFLGSLETVRSIADRFDISESTFCQHNRRILHVFSENLLRKFISWPDVDKQIVHHGFQQKKGFPDVIGCIDGTHIKIKPPHGHAVDYLNRKRYYSVVLQAVCREDKRFTDIYAGWPGRVHDARVLRNSPLWQQGANLCGPCHLLGDGAYPCRSWLLTPYRNWGNLTRNQIKFNKTLSGTRVLIENAFGLLKGRFRRLQFIDMSDISYITKVIATACILHNICIIQGDELEEYFACDVDEHLLDRNRVVFDNDAEGQLKRNLLTHQFARM